MVEEKEVKKSVFNPALQYLEGLIKLIDIYDMQMLKGDFLSCFKTLQRIFLRIEHKLDKKKESDKIKKSFDDSKMVFNRKNISKEEKVSLFQEELIKIEMEIKRLMNDYGLLMPSADDPRFAAYE